MVSGEIPHSVMDGNHTETIPLLTLWDDAANLLETKVS